VIVFDTTNKRDLYRKRVTLADDKGGNSAVQTVYQVGRSSEEGLQFNLLRHSEEDYEAFIRAIRNGKTISTVKTHFNSRLTVDWDGTSYMYLIEPL
jgi:hypothetical protein